MEKWPVSEEFYVKFESLKFQQFYLMKFDFFQSFNFDLKLAFFPLWKNYEILKKASVIWRRKDMGVASSWEWHTYFS